METYFHPIFMTFKEYKCGIPGHSLKGVIKTDLSDAKVFDDGMKVKYSCDYNDAPFLIGHDQRECIEGEWTQSIPKCATLYTGYYDYNYTLNGNAINISLANSAAIMGLVVKVSSLEPIEVVNIKNIPSPDCFVANHTFKDKNPYHLTKRYSTLFHCPTKDITFHTKVDWILITFNDKFRNCELISCPAILEFIELYEIISDECLKPDVPPFGKLVPIKPTGAKKDNSIVRYKYLCEDFFVMEDQRVSEIVCTPYKEWSQKAMPKCVPNTTCEVEPLDHLKVDYNWLWSDTHAVVGTVATIECVDNTTKLNGTAKRECNPDGQWSDDWPQCIAIPSNVETTTELTSTSSHTTPYVQQSTQSYPPTQQQLPNPYPTQPLYPYPPPQPISTTPKPIESFPQLTNQSLNSILFVYILSGVLSGILVTICVIYYMQKKRRESLAFSHSNRHISRSAMSNARPARDVYFEHMNHETQLANESVDNQLCQYDAAGYIQIEALESMSLNSMNTFKKYENYDINGKKHYKPLPEVPKPAPVCSTHMY